MSSLKLVTLSLALSRQGRGDLQYSAGAVREPPLLQRLDIVDQMPYLVLGQLITQRRHRCTEDALVDELEQCPVRVQRDMDSEVCRSRLQSRTGGAIAHASDTMTQLAVFFVQSHAERDGLLCRRHRISRWQLLSSAECAEQQRTTGNDYHRAYRHRR